MSRHYFNEFDPAAAAWLRELMRAGLIPEGDVDERSITEVAADDLRGYRSVHLFAGIGGWAYALRLAGWPDERPVWTGSCPCQPYSAAGKGLGDADPRNLWPHFFRLIRECRPDVCFGEQVEGAVRHGWLDGVCADLEGEGYAVGSAVLGAHSVGAPHIRQRLFWVADAGRCRCGARTGHRRGVEAGKRDEPRVEPEHHGCTCRVADPNGGQPGHGRVQPGREHRQQPADGIAGVVVGNALGTRPQGRGAGVRAEPGDSGRGRPPSTASDAGFWDAYDLIPCRDGKTRRVEPGSFPLADGIPGRVGLLRGYGNAIVPQVAAEFVAAYLEAVGGAG